MSFNYQPLISTSVEQQYRTGLGSSLSNIYLDVDADHSSFVLYTGNKPSLYVDKFGNVGVNTTSPTSQLEVASPNGSCLRLRYGNTINSLHADMFMTSSGNLAINTTASGSKIITSSTFDISSHNGTSIGLRLAGALVESTAEQLNYTKVSTGVATASKALVLDSMRNISGINSLSSSILIGTIATAIQPNITSVGTLVSLNLSSDTIRTSSPTLNISSNSVAPGNIFISSATKQVCFNTQTPQTGYQMTINGSTSLSGLFVSGTNTMLCFKNLSTSGSGRSVIQFLSDQDQPIEIGQRNSGDATNPNGFYVYGTRYLMSLTTRGMMSIPNAYETGLNIGNTTTGFTAERKVIVCDSDILSNTRQCFYIGYSLATNNSACFSYYHAGSGSSSNRIGIGFFQNEDIWAVLPSGNIGIGNIAPQAPLHISKFVSTTISNSEQSYGVATSTGYVTQTSNQNVNIGMKVDYGVLVGSAGVYVSSDRRLKTNIHSIDRNDALKFIMDTEPRIYNLKETNRPQLGYIAQELKSSPFGQLVSHGFEKKEFPAQAPGDIENVVLVAQYERICCILHRGLQDALDRISVLEAKLNNTTL